MTMWGKDEPVYPPCEVGGLQLTAFEGPAIEAIIPALAELRVTVFRDWPYLYDGSADYERGYLGNYASAEGGFVVGAFDGNALVGAATGAPLAGQPAAWAAPLEAAGYSVEDVFYCGESVLLGSYRGRGVGHAFFDAREAKARSLGLSYCAFCSVIRPEDHPRRPSSAHTHDAFWRKRGYAPLDGAIARFAWQDVGDNAETEKPLQFWPRTL